MLFLSQPQLGATASTWSGSSRLAKRGLLEESLQEELADAEKQREKLTQSFDSLMAESVTVRNRSERLYLE